MERELSLNQQLIKLPTSSGAASRPVTMRRQEVLKDLECPVCFELIFPPVKDCCNGHHVCSICLEKITLCPLCKEPAGITQNRFAEDFLEKYVVRCPNQKPGCKAFYWKEEELKFNAHKEMCKYREIQCWVPNCNTQTFHQFLFTHWELDHQIICTGTAEETFQFSITLDTSYIHQAIHLQHNGHAFLAIFQAHRRETSTYVYGYCPSDTLPLYQCCITLKVETRDASGGIGTKTHEWSGPVFHEAEKPNDIFESKRDFFEKLPQIDDLVRELHGTITVRIVPRITTIPPNSGDTVNIRDDNDTSNPILL